MAARRWRQAIRVPREAVSISVPARTHPLSAPALLTLAVLPAVAWALPLDPVSPPVGTLRVNAAAETRLELVNPAGRKSIAKAPYENPRATPGIWTIVARAPGFEAQKQSIAVSRDTVSELKFELQALGALKVTGSPWGATVRVAGPGGFSAEGQLPWAAHRLWSGSYQVTVSEEGYRQAHRAVEVRNGQLATVNVSLLAGADVSLDEPAPPDPVELPAPSSADQEALRKFLHDGLPSIQACYERELKADAALAGTIGVQFLITTTGRMGRASITNDTLYDDSVSKCIIGLISSWVSPAKPGTDTPVAYHLVFRPDE